MHKIKHLKIWKNEGKKTYALLKLLNRVKKKYKSGYKKIK